MKLTVKVCSIVISFIMAFVLAFHTPLTKSVMLSKAILSLTLNLNTTFRDVFHTELFRGLFHTSSGVVVSGELITSNRPNSVVIMNYLGKPAVTKFDGWAATNGNAYYFIHELLELCLKHVEKYPNAKWDGD